MKRARRNFALAQGACGAKAYAFGGLSPFGDALATVEKYSIDKDEWEVVATLDQPLVGAVAVTMPDGIYLLGD